MADGMYFYFHCGSCMSVTCFTLSHPNQAHSNSECKRDHVRHTGTAEDLRGGGRATSWMLLQLKQQAWSRINKGEEIMVLFIMSGFVSALHFIFTTSPITARAVGGSQCRNEPRQIDAIFPQSSSLRCRDRMKITRDDVFSLCLRCCKSFSGERPMQRKETLHQSANRILAPLIFRHFYYSDARKFFVAV